MQGCVVLLNVEPTPYDYITTLSLELNFTENTYRGKISFFEFCPVSCFSIYPKEYHPLER